ncbi:MAG: hypothetical protein KatS3mg077_0380 [Candidatus Binatia bacterium]|nr:MAG: hypothetical protein KatS3mg077_0380 [Candidatus Binatia bacterium]
MIRYFCDRCETEVEHHADLTTLSVEIGESGSTSNWRLRRELCAKCLEEAKEFLTKFLAKSQPKKRTA